MPAYNLVTLKMDKSLPQLPCQQNYFLCLLFNSSSVYGKMFRAAKSLAQMLHVNSPRLPLLLHFIWLAPGLIFSQGSEYIGE